MRCVMLSELMDEYEDLLPDLTEIEGLDLNWENLFDCCNDDYPYPNFGVDDLYSIGASGHEYLVFAVQPNLPVDRYPIAVFNEENGTSIVIASSIKNWFPCYLVDRINQLVVTYRGEDEEEKALAESGLSALALNRAKIEKFAEEFANRDFQQALPAIFDAVAKKGEGWNYAASHRAADGGSCIDDLIDLEQKGSAAAVKTFIKKNPSCNGAVRVLHALGGTFDRELAEKVLTLSVTLDLGGRENIYAILKAAAEQMRTDESYEESPLAGLIDELCDSEDPCIAHFYYEAAISFANDGELLLARACYDNAIFFSWAEEGSFHCDSFDEICYLAQEIGDKNYLSYIRSLRFDGDLSDDVPDEEEDEEEPDFAADDAEDEEEEEEEDEEGLKKKPAPKKKKKS
jgi:hypothetical protein